MTTDNPTVWLCIPSINLEYCARYLPAWKQQGYRVAVSTDEGMVQRMSPMIGGMIDLLVSPRGEYPGYWRSMNALTRFVMNRSTHLTYGHVSHSFQIDGIDQIIADVCVVAGDDMEPDDRHSAQDIARHFLRIFPGGYGVMQPTGSGEDGVDRIAGSPWIGRAWIEEAYRGNGPYHDGYFHFYGDEELLNVARAQAAFIQLSQYRQRHHQWCNPDGHNYAKRTHYQQRNSDNHWEADKALFFRRQREGFPGSERLPV